jgi:RNA polymerase sigma factor (sigma-70 family)
MAHMASTSLVRQIGTLFEGGCSAGLSDRQLLERFTARGEPADEAAFAAMVARHGPMVLGVCRQLLGDHHHAEDAFQAVFLVLARRARSIRDPDLLGTWLYGVALRTARKARARLVRRRHTEEEGAVDRPEARSAVQAAQMVDRELADALHHEIDLLPGAFRVPVVLCYFEGLTLDEAAHRLRWPAGTVRSRLARARDKLRRGLTRRGIVLPAAALATVLDARPVSAALSSSLCDITARAAVDFMAKPAAAGTLSTPAMALAKEVLRSMLLHKLKLTVVTLLLLGAVASGAGFVGQTLARQAGKPDLRQIAGKADDVNPKPVQGRMFVVGRVVDSQGKPVSGASVMVYAQSIPRVTTSAEQLSLKELGRAASDGSGRFRIDVPRTSSSRHDEFGAVALAPGYGAGWVASLDPDADQPSVDIVLFPERVIHGRLFDLQGQPAGNVKLSVTAIRRDLPKRPSARRPDFEGPTFWWTHSDDLAGWPRPAISSANGHFTLHGVGPGLRAYLSVLDARFSNQLIEIDTDDASTTKPLSFALEPARTITGRVTYADTGKAVPHARVTVSGIYKAEIDGGLSIATSADAEGRFRATTGTAGVNVSASAPDGQPYLSAFLLQIDWPKGAVTHSADLALPRGVMMNGSIVEQGSGRPISGATAIYSPRRTANDGIVLPRSRSVETVADGSFALAVLPRAGYLAVRGPTDDYVLQELDSGLFDQGQPGRQRIYAHAFVARDPKPGSESKDVPDVKAVLRPGVTLKGQIVGPNGEQVMEAWLLSRIHLRPRGPQLRIWSGDRHGTARNGRFELHGLGPDSEVPVSFFEPKRKLGATVIFTGKPAGGEPIVVKLAPCATAAARLVGHDGKPLAEFAPPSLISMVVTPGEFSAVKARKVRTTIADEDSLTNIDPINYQKDPASNAEGRIVFPALIPGAKFRIVDRTTIRTPNGPQLRKEFTVKPGETLDLGDLLIEKSPP